LFDQHQNQLLMSSDIAHARRALRGSWPDVCARCLLNTNYMGGPVMALLMGRERERERRQDRPMVPAND